MSESAVSHVLVYFPSNGCQKIVPLSSVVGLEPKTEQDFQKSKRYMVWLNGRGAGNDVLLKAYILLLGGSESAVQQKRDRSRIRLPNLRYMSSSEGGCAPARRNLRTKKAKPRNKVTRQKQSNNLKALAMRTVSCAILQRYKVNMSGSSKSVYSSSSEQEEKEKEKESEKAVDDRTVLHRTDSEETVLINHWHEQDQPEPVPQFGKTLERSITGCLPGKTTPILGESSRVQCTPSHLCAATPQTTKSSSRPCTRAAKKALTEPVRNSPERRTRNVSTRCLGSETPPSVRPRRQVARYTPRSRGSSCNNSSRRRVDESRGDRSELYGSGLRSSNTHCDPSGDEVSVESPVASSARRSPAVMLRRVIRRTRSESNPYHAVTTPRQSPTQRQTECAVQKRSSVPRDLMQIYENTSVDYDVWDVMLHKTDSKFTKDVAVLLWGEERLAQRCLSPTRANERINPGEPRRLPLTPEKYEALKDCLDHKLRVTGITGRQRLYRLSKVWRYVSAKIYDVRRKLKFEALRLGAWPHGVQYSLSYQRLSQRYTFEL